MKVLHNKYVTVILAAVAVACGFSSCGTPIPMQEMVPAKIAVPRNARVHISTSGPGAYAMQQAAQQVIGSDEFFSIVYGNADLGIRIDTDRTVEHRSYTDKKGRTSHYTVENSYADISLLNYHNQSVITSTGRLHVGSNFSDGNCRDAVQEFYDLIHPRIVDYTERVSIDKSDNPNLYIAAQLCQAGKWEEAYVKVQESIAAVPNDPEAYFLKAMIEREDSKFDESDATLQQAMQIEAKSKYSKALQKNAVLRVTQEQAIEQMNNAL